MLTVEKDLLKTRETLCILLFSECESGIERSVVLDYHETI